MRRYILKDVVKCVCVCVCVCLMSLTLLVFHLCNVSKRVNISMKIGSRKMCEVMVWKSLSE